MFSKICNKFQKFIPIDLKEDYNVSITTSSFTFDFKILYDNLKPG